MSGALPMVGRFQYVRWSGTRQLIDAMETGTARSFPASEYFNAHSSVQRLNDAYEGTRQWSLCRSSGRLTVTRIK